jgi:tRNA-specific 2-thiouridylase
MVALTKRRIVAALSGGVDSAVAAARAVDAGHDVVGVHLALSRSRAEHRNGSRGCCTIEDSHDARRIADMLGIPFYVWDLSEAFERDVIDDFVAEYEAGRTPNPCIRCNESIKFAAVLERAVALGFDGVATGHYARIVEGPDGPELHRGIDPGKDQSYVLGVLGRDLLDRALFPLGDSVKDDVRREAADRGLLVARKADSHDICFIADGDTAGFLRERLGERPGTFVDEAGDVVGEHDGAYAFTVGQRRGLHLGVPAADGRPRFVLAVEPVSGTVTVGPKERLAVSVINTAAPRWASVAFPIGESVVCSAQWRAHGQPSTVAATWDGSSLRLELVEPAHGVAPGQEIVLYDGSRVLASARIVAAA